MKSKDQQLLEEAYTKVQLNELDLSKLNPFKKKQAAPVANEQPKQQPAEQPKSPKEKLFDAAVTLVNKASNVKVVKTSQMDGDKHDSTIFYVNGKKVVDLTYPLDSFQIINSEGGAEKVDVNSGAKGLDQIYNALRNAGAAFDHNSEEYAYSQL